MRTFLIICISLLCVACTSVPQQGTVATYTMPKVISVIQQADKENFKTNHSFSNLEDINTFVNNVHYVSDKNDEWKTPKDFFANGGDCEDYAIAKYTIAKQMGISEDRMRIAVVIDKQKVMYHAILLIKDGKDNTLVLDNQTKTIKTLSSVSSRYKFIYSANKYNTIIY